MPPTRTDAPTTPTSVVPVAMETQQFGVLEAIPLLGDNPPYGGPTTPTSLDGVLVFEPTEALLAVPGVRDMLELQGFAVVEGDARLFHPAYSYDEYVPYPVFVTTDVAFHAWHLAFDKVLRDLEEETLLPVLEGLVDGLVDRARAQAIQLTGTALSDAADRVAQFYEAAATVLELDVGPIGPLATAEVALIREHAQYTSSPITSFESCETGVSPANCVDYSLYKPRGHYTRNPDLERYFRAMSVLGQGAFFLDANSLRLGALATRVLLVDEVAVGEWQRIYKPTAFLIGAADDYTPFELAAVISTVAGGLDEPSVLADDQTMEAIADSLEALRSIQINPEAASVRIMGVRLTLDSYILDQLVHPRVADRFVASVRDVAAAFGSEWASASLTEDGYTSYPEYGAQLGRMQQMVADRSIDDWGRTVYDAWLYALQPVWSPHGTAYPDFMQTDAWAAKAGQAGFGSYAELKHDTILYTKQAVAEGGNGEPPLPPRHWVEPEPAVFARIGAAAKLLREGLAGRDLLDDSNAAILLQIEDEMEFLAGIAADELAGLSIADEANRRLQSFGGWMEFVWLNTSDLDRIGEDGGPDEDAALVADILLSASNGVLEVATGKIDDILVIVPNDGGEFQLAAGGVYSFYEFWQDPEKRLADEEWRAMLDEGQAPPRPSWTSTFVVSR